MKLTRKQWYLILLGILIILLLWFMAKQKGSSGQGATSDPGIDTSSGDANLPAPTEAAAISGRNGRVGESVVTSPYTRTKEVLI